MSKSGKSLLKHCFLKKELSSNWLETLRIKWNHWDSLLCLNRERLRPFLIQDMSYNNKKNAKYRQKRKICKKYYTRKRCSPNQVKIKLITKKIKHLCLLFLQVTTIVSQMTRIIAILRNENKNLQKKANSQKSRKLVLWKLVVARRQTIWGKSNRYEEQIVVQRINVCI